MLYQFISLFLVSRGLQELIPLNYDKHIMTNIIGRVHVYLGTYNESTQSVFDLDDPKKYEKHMADYDLLIIPGGVKALEYLRQQTNALKFINEWDSKGINLISHETQNCW